MFREEFVGMQFEEMVKVLEERGCEVDAEFPIFDEDGELQACASIEWREKWCDYCAEFDKDGYCEMAYEV